MNYVYAVRDKKSGQWFSGLYQHFTKNLNSARLYSKESAAKGAITYKNLSGVADPEIVCFEMVESKPIEACDV